MRQFSRLILALLLLAGMASCKQEPQVKPEYPFNDPSLSKEERVNDLLGRLTAEEKVTMMIVVKNHCRNCVTLLDQMHVSRIRSRFHVTV